MTLSKEKREGIKNHPPRQPNAKRGLELLYKQKKSDNYDLIRKQREPKAKKGSLFF